MALRVMYRSYGGENRKDRPDYYGKLLCLVSFLRAAEGLGLTPVFINDGPMPEDRLQLMRDAGEIVQLPGLGMRGSYVAALQHATSGRWNHDDLVWFSEDDYLYAPESLRQLNRAATEIPTADYFALYGSTDLHPLGNRRRPAGWRVPTPVEVGAHQWVQIQSTASSFGARLGALQQDMGIFRFCMVPHRTMFRDHDTCLVIQGFEPYRYADIGRALIGLSPGGARLRVRELALSPFKLATNLRAHRRSGRRRVLMCADPNLATHLEEGQLSPATDWESLAEETRQWGLARGMISEVAQNR